MTLPIDIATLIPHQGSMCLLAGVVSWDNERIRCYAVSHRDPHNPLRLTDPTGLPALSAIEYGAQAVAVHGGLLAQGGKPRAGYLANAKNVRWFIERLDQVEDDLTVDAEKLISEGGRSIYEFSVSAQGRLLACGQVAVVLDGEAA